MFVNDFVKKTFLGVLGLIISVGVHGQYFTTNGDASSLGGDCYQLTPDLENQQGSIWYSELIDISRPFDLKFTMNFGTENESGADGMVFVLQTVGNTALGANGSDIGFGGFSPSLGIEFDTYNNSTTTGDISDDHIAILYDGTTDHNSAYNIAGHVEASMNFIWPQNIEDEADHDVRIHWDPTDNNLLEVYF
ncbi:MAG: hypothetical protein C0594_15505, partial [Marinilabiliales bacterium]